MSLFKFGSFYECEFPVLTSWLALGLAWFLLGMMFLPSSKLYHQGLIVLFWLPGLAAWWPGVRAGLSWDRWLLAGLFACIAWAALSVIWGGDSKRYKEMLYVVLCVQSFVVLAGLYRDNIWRLLACLAMFGSLGAMWAIVDFYLLQGRPLGDRLVGTGLLNHPILAGHLMGALAVLLLGLRSQLPAVLARWGWLLAFTAYVSFMVLTRSKGPLLALIAASLVLPICALSLRRVLFAGMTLLGATLAALLFPEFFLRGGFSYRPDLLISAWELFLHQPWLGLGLGSSYELGVIATKSTYEHAHNLFFHLLLQLGVPGLVLWLLVQLTVLCRAWSNRMSAAGLVLCSLFVFSVVALMTDGVGPWGQASRRVVHGLAADISVFRTEVDSQCGQAGAFRMIRPYFPRGSENVGDELNAWLWPALLGDIVCGGDIALLGVGTLLNEPFCRQLRDESHIAVLGTGLGYGAPPSLDDRWKFYAVRGPRTARALGLPPSVAMADAAYLLAGLEWHAGTASDELVGEVVVVPHHRSLPLLDWQGLCDEAGLRFLSPLTPAEAFMARLKTARLVLAEAMPRCDSRRHRQGSLAGFQLWSAIQPRQVAGLVRGARNRLGGACDSGFL